MLKTCPGHFRCPAVGPTLAPQGQPSAAGPGPSGPPSSDTEIAEDVKKEGTGGGHRIISYYLQQWRSQTSVK